MAENPLQAIPGSARPVPDGSSGLRDTARRALVASLVVGGVIVAGLLLWKLRVLVALLFLALTIAAAMRPGVKALKQRGVPRGIGILVHYAVLAALLTVFLSFVIPLASHEIQAGLGSLPTSSSELETAARSSTGLKQDALRWVQRQIEGLSSFRGVLDPALAVTLRTFEFLLGMLFTLACAAYWILERDHAETIFLSLMRSSRRPVVRETWRSIERKLGAYVRGVGLLVLLVGVVLSFAFWLIGLPYYLLLGMFAGVLEVVPVLGPLLAGAIAMAVGFTVSWQVAILAGLAVLVVRLVEDYLVIPRVLGDAVGLSPLVVLLSVSAVTILFGGFAVLLAIPLAAAVATLVEVLVHGRVSAPEESSK
jgi:predicted PurR-regulated permease PerM